MNPALRTDRYEYTMASAALESGMGAHRAVFECFARRLPQGRSFGVAAGLGRLLEMLEDFVVDDAVTDSLVGIGALTPEGARSLRGRPFDGRIWAYPEGELWFPGSPVAVIEAEFAIGTLIETLVLSTHNFDSAIASAAARMRLAAGDRTLIEMGTRRIHDGAAIDAARAAYIGGFDLSSNLAAGDRWGVPTAGTAAHAFTLAYVTERAAFDAQIATWGVGTTLLVDTFDIAAGIAAAIDAARAVGATGPGGVRIDSGDPHVEVPRARALLDSLGAYDTKVVISGDLDEWVIDSLAGAPVGTYGVGSQIVTGSGHPSAGFVYKLVEIDGRHVAKRSSGKPSVGGRKWARRHIVAGVAVAEELTFAPVDDASRPLLELVWDNGPVGPRRSVADARARCAASLAELDTTARAIAPRGAAVAPAIPTVGEATTPAVPTPYATEVAR